VPHRFTFEESEDEEAYAEDWEVIIKKLRPDGGLP
jgi:hypothetical protein